MQRFIRNADNTVTDTETGLTWSATLLSGKRVTEAAALKTIAELGEGWRLPTVKELFNIVEHGREEPAIDTDAFPDTESTWYWTATPCAWNSSAVWVVFFSLGYVGDVHRNYYACVRAVRSSQ